jgi:hypothetical protein
MSESTAAKNLTKQATLINGKLYWDLSAVSSAQGSVSGLTGTWLTPAYTSTDSKPYSWYQLNFDAAGNYTSTTTKSALSDKTDATVTSSTGTYTIADGVLTYNSSSTSKYMYAIYGSYLIIGPTNTTLGGWTKQ